MSHRSELNRALRELPLRDAKLAKFMEISPPCDLGRDSLERSHFETLTLSIISQQISTKAADAIAQRVKTLVHGDFSPNRFTKTSATSLREAGLSNAKVRTVQELAHSMLNGEIDTDLISAMPDSEVIDALTNVWGIGRWTAEMFLIFSLNRLDVWPSGDLGVRKGWSQIFGGEPLDAKSFEVMGDRFRPYRSIVAWYCWRATDELIGN